MTDSLVHNKETSGRFALAESFQTHLASRNEIAFERGIDFYRAVDLEHTKNYRLKAMNCRCKAWFARSSRTGQVRVMSEACHLRWCFLCSQARRTYISQAVAKWIRDGKYRKFCTLTLKHTDAPLDFQIDKLYTCFQKLKKSKLFSSKVAGGVWFFQIKRTKTTGQWHPHIHCIISGLFLPQGQLSKVWKKITTDSTIVDLRMVRDPDKAANEVARYATAPANLETTEPVDYVTIFNALHKRRTAGTWGLRGKVSLTQPAADDKNEWVKLGSWGLIRDRQGSDENADLIIKAWQQDKPLDDGITYNMVEIEAANRYVEKYLSSPVKYYTDLFTES